MYRLARSLTRFLPTALVGCSGGGNGAASLQTAPGLGTSARVSRTSGALAVAALLAAVLTGCGAARSGAASAPPTTHHRAPATNLAVTYPIRSAMGSKSKAAAACPTGASCTLTSVGTTGTGAKIWMPVAHMHLACTPAGGTYRDPGAACRALRDLQRLRHAHPQVCMCPMMPGNAEWRLYGTVDGTEMNLNLGACALCGLGSAGIRDATTLMPGAFSS